MREAQGREGVRKSDDKKTKGKALRRTRNKTEKKKKRTIKRGSGAKGRRKSQRLYNRNRKQKSQRRLKTRRKIRPSRTMRAEDAAIRLSYRYDERAKQVEFSRKLFLHLCTA